MPRWRGACSCAAALLLLGSSSAATTPALPVDLGRKTNKSTAAGGLGGRVLFVGSGEEAPAIGVALDLTTALLRALLATPESRRQQQQHLQDNQIARAMGLIPTGDPSDLSIEEIAKNMGLDGGASGAGMSDAPGATGMLTTGAPHATSGPTPRG